MFRPLCNQDFGIFPLGLTFFGIMMQKDESKDMILGGKSLSSW
jgi:hypothetical protein